MTKTIFLFITLLMLALSVNSSAEDKWIITSITPLAEVYVKHMDNRIADAEGRIRNWTKTEYNKDENILSLVEYDCNDRKIRIIESIEKYEGEPETNYTEIKEWEKVIPESIDDAAFKYVCETALPTVLR
ncbi:surface-adhesin E family protein [Nitrospirota bacterium]